MGEHTGLLWPWTESDRARVFEQHAKGVRVLCPLDDTPLKVVKRSGQVRFRCLRCGNTSTQEALKLIPSDRPGRTA